jgi:hypothetical protein
MGPHAVALQEAAEFEPTRLGKGRNPRSDRSVLDARAQASFRDSWGRRTVG